MSAFFSGPQIVALIIALAVAGLAVAGIVWVGRVIRGELGSSGARRPDPTGAAPPKRAPPATMRKEPVAPPAPLAPVPRAAPPAPMLPPDIPPAMRAMLDAEKPRFWCPMCGTELQLPTFPPLVSRCSTCGKKSAIRAEEGGRYVVNVSPPPKLP